MPHPQCALALWKASATCHRTTRRHYGDLREGNVTGRRLVRRHDNVPTAALGDCAASRPSRRVHDADPRTRMNENSPTEVSQSMSLVSDVGALAEFLRRHRERLTPEKVGIQSRGARRVPGLRREEVAMRAGISVEYYIRLEQGRERSPSLAVCEALAGALSLGRYETRHLYELAEPRKSCRDEHLSRPRVPEASRVLLDTLEMPAFIQNRYADVIATNPAGEALSPSIRVGVNRIRALFTDPAVRALHLEWDSVTENAVAQLRLAVGGGMARSPARELITELLRSSPRFRCLWSDHQVAHAPVSPVRLKHPAVGLLVLFRQQFLIAGTDDLSMVVYHAHPASSSWSALQRLVGQSAESKPNASH